MITEYISDSNKIGLIEECIEDKDKTKDLKKAIFSSIITTIFIYTILGFFFPSFVILNPLVLFGLFMVTSFFFYLLFVTPQEGMSVYKKYVVYINNGIMSIKFVNIKDFETVYTISLDKIGGFGISDKIMNIKCRKHKLPLRGKIIEIFGKNGKKIFEFGFWLHEFDAKRLYEDLITIAPILRNYQ